MASDEAPIKPPPEPIRWVPDDIRANCLGCKEEFSWYLRRHHCRACGEVFCDDCTAAQIMVSGYKTLQRGCNGCLQKALEAANPQKMPGEVEAVVWENQRHYPVIGWATNLLPTDPVVNWTDQFGNASPDITALDDTLPNGWRWKCEWTARRDETTAHDTGWSYAMDFPRATDLHTITWYPIDNSTRYVRRRIWTRIRERTKAAPMPFWKGVKPDPGAVVEAEEKAVTVYENQRYYPFAGWTDMLMYTDREAWSDREGNPRECKDEMEPPDGWEWKAEDSWTRCDDGAGVDGWLYAVDFPAAEWTPEPELLDHVRRRRWTRVAIKTIV